MTTDLRMTTEDVLASTQVLSDVADASDSMTPDQAVDYRLACEAVVNAAKFAIDMLNQHLVQTLDGQDGIVRDGFRYYIGQKADKKIFDHDSITHQIAKAVLAYRDPDGLEPTRAQAIKLAVDWTRETYVSPSTSAKVGQLDRLGINRNENAKGSVLEVHRGANEVKRTPAGGETDG